jgi:hypothetical protein
MKPMPAPKSDKKKLLIVTNDSEAFLSKKLEAAGDLFGGRVTEIKDFVKSMESEFGKEGNDTWVVSFGIISTLFGFVPSTYCITQYSYAMNNKEQYQAVQDRKDYAGTLEYVSRGYDKVLVCVPKEMFRIMVDNFAFHKGKIIAVTSKEFEGVCKEYDWVFLERKGARLGKENAEKVRQVIRDIAV